MCGKAAVSPPGPLDSRPGLAGGGPVGHWQQNWHQHVSCVTQFFCARMSLRNHPSTWIYFFFINESWTRLLENLGQPVTCHLHLAEPRCRKGVFNGAAERELQKHCRPCLFYLQCRLMLSLVQYGLIYPAHCEMHFFFLDVDAELRRNEGISRVSQTRGLMPAGISHIFKWVLQSRCSSQGYNSQKWGAAGKITQSCDHTLWLLWILFFHEIIQDPQMT